MVRVIEITFMTGKGITSKCPYAVPEIGCRQDE
jgi:hypothetical protein